MISWLLACVPADPPSREAEAEVAAVPVRVPGSVTPRQLGPADAVAAADLNGDGNDELVLVHQGVATWDAHSVELGGGLQATARGDIDGDGVEELLLGTGFSRGFREAPARVWVLDETGGRAIFEDDGPRNQIADLRIVDGRIWLVRFVDQWNAAGGWLSEGTHTPLASMHMGSQQLPMHGGVLVGAVYGEEPKSDGALWWVDDGGRKQLPSLRGVRTLATADLDGDGEPEVLMGDGWHASYAANADARVVLLDGEGWGEHRAIAWLSDDYTVRGIEADGHGRLLLTGTSHAHRLERDALGWKLTKLADLRETDNAVFVQQDGALGVLVSGQPARLLGF